MLFPCRRRYHDKNGVFPVGDFAHLIWGFAHERGAPRRHSYRSVATPGRDLRPLPEHEQAEQASGDVLGVSLLLCVFARQSLLPVEAGYSMQCFVFGCGCRVAIHPDQRPTARVMTVFRVAVLRP
jgi:hypothetical protein